MYPDAKAYHAKYASFSPSKAKDALAALEAQVPWDLVRRYLLSIAPGPVSRLCFAWMEKGDKEHI